jgi:hypothetical protein
MTMGITLELYQYDASVFFFFFFFFGKGTFLFFFFFFFCGEWDTPYSNLPEKAAMVEIFLPRGSWRS